MKNCWQSAFLLGFFGLVLSCAGEPVSLVNPAPCPGAYVLKDAARIVAFEEGGSKISNLRFSGEITKVTSICRYSAKTPIEANLEFEMTFGRGPAAVGNKYQVKYFVAVVKPNAHVIDKQEFSKIIVFKDNKKTVSFREVFDKITIPRATDELSGTNFQIIIGFSLNRKQTLYNRSNKSLKFPSL